ncbi:MAG: DUF6340 family protein [Bacteroidales bacterium]|nr:DUF6340 family protein [Bacteroidales bacterium]MCF8389384.1 DUF6340 family protein [Bacteroidales bacterium]
MKTQIKNSLILLLTFFIFAAPSISFDALFPASLRFPEHIKTIAVIDRSARNTKLINILEGGITGEGIGQDRFAGQKCIDGLIDQVDDNIHIRFIRTNIEMITEGKPGNMAPLLPTADLKGICLEYNADAVLSLEYFDTDRNGEFIDAKLGFRIYDLASNSVIEEYKFSKSGRINSYDNNLINIINTAVESDPVIYLSYDAGRAYGKRITPYWQRVTRTYYKKGGRDKDLAQGARMMEVNNWEAAIASFEISMERKKRKTQGRSAHNLAVVYEILSEYEKALEYSQLAWGKYENKDSKVYSDILSRRIQDVKILNEE